MTSANKPAVPPFNSLQLSKSSSTQKKLNVVKKKQEEAKTPCIVPYPILDFSDEELSRISKIVWHYIHEILTWTFKTRYIP